VIEPSELFFGCGSNDSGRTSLKLIRICGGANIVKVGEGRGGWSRGGTMSLKASDVAVIKRLLKMTKTELQIALAEATQTNKRTAGVFLERSALSLTKRQERPVNSFFAALGKLAKQKRAAPTGFNPKTQQKIRIPAKTVLKFRVAKVAKDTVLGVKR